MNAIPEFKAETFADPNLLKMAEELLAGVKAGRITGLGIVIQSAQGVTSATFGNPPLLYLGADLMKDDIKKMLTGGVGSKLVRPN